MAVDQDNIPLDPDWDRYFEFDLLNVLQVLTLRSNGALVGYCFMLVFPHLHYASTRWAQSDIYWIDPAYRSGWTGVRMFKEVEKGMRALSVKKVLISVKLHFEADRGTVGKLLTRLGYEPVDLVYGKLLG